jgi:hypothetical protein
MKLIYKELLEEYGFFENHIKSQGKHSIMTKKEMDVIIKNDAFYCFFLDSEIQLKHLTHLKLLYKDINGEELNRGGD